MKRLALTRTVVIVRFPVLALIVALGGCAILPDTEGDAVTSTAFEPPAAWESAVLFSFADGIHFPNHPYAARVEFTTANDQRHVVTGRDLFYAPGGDLRSAWYRVPLRGGEPHPLLIRIIVTDTLDAVSVAEYPLTVEPNHFYDVNFGVTTRTQPRPAAPSLAEGRRSYPVTPEARMQPTDSLFVSYFFRTRNCFDCPF